jgi:hyperosmotically inducible protein
MWRHGQRFPVWAAVVLVVLMHVGCAAITGRQSPGESVSDTTLTTKVKTSLLADAALGGLTIDVDTTGGVVSLNGIVSSEQERQRAIQVAQSVQGVKRVDARNLMVRR